MAINMVIIFAFLAMILWAVGDFFTQRSTRKIGSIYSLAWIGLAGTFGLLPFIFDDFSLLMYAPNLFLITGLGIISFISAMLYFGALKEGKLSVVDVILEAELPVTIILSIIFLKEILTFQQIIVIFFILVGILLTATKSFSHLKTRIEKGVILAFLASIIFGISNVLVGVSAKTISPMMTIWGSWTVFTIISLTYIFSTGKFGEFYLQGARNKKLVATMAVIDTLSWIFYAFALVNAEISIVTAITESYPALALYLGVVFNKEKVRWYQYLGAFIAILCSILLSTTL